MVRLAEIRKGAADYLTKPVAGLLAKTPITPNALSWTGLLLTTAAALLIVYGHLLAAGAVVLVAGFFDMLDGALARLTKQTTRFGAILDSTLDRMAEAMLLLSILVIFARNQLVAESLLVGVVLFGSLMVSYLRARAEALGLECKGGLFTRPERVAVLALGLLLSRIDYALVIALAVIAVLSFFTAGQRFYSIWQRTRTG